MKQDDIDFLYEKYPKILAMLDKKELEDISDCFFNLLNSLLSGVSTQLAMWNTWDETQSSLDIGEIPLPIQQVEITEIKEEKTSLSMIFSGGNSYTEGLFDMAEIISKEIKEKSKKSTNLTEWR
jgi:hypothetical protein